jgi:hypothetical protein
MPGTPAQQVLDHAQSVAFMRNFYASLGMRKLTLERAIRHSRGLPLAPAEPALRRRPGRPRRKLPAADPAHSLKEKARKLARLPPAAAALRSR